MVRVEINKIKAEIKDFVWKCSDSFMKKTLEFHTEWFLKLNRLGPEHGDPEYRIAEYIIKHLGGEITEHDYTDYDPEVIY